MPFDPKQLSTFPSDPGVYIMKDKKGVVIYVGKAKNIKKRVRQYFGKSGDGREMLPYLVARVETIETIVVSSEKEALLLENTLIKEHQPKYNVFFRDDKSYVCLKVNHKHEWPTVQVVRFKGRPKNGGKYFGPYTNAGAARETLDLINRVFPLRQCSDQELARRTRPCILYQMHRCCAPCVNYCSKDEYKHYVKQAVSFLEGKNKSVIKDLEKEMQKASEALEFETAGEIHRKIKQIERSLEKQQVERVDDINADILGLYRHGSDIVLNQLVYRHGKLLGSYNFLQNGVLDEDDQVISKFIVQFYGGRDELPHEILVSATLSDASEIEELLSQSSKHKVTLHRPQRGTKTQLVKMAHKNAEAFFNKEKDEEAIRQKMLGELQDKLRLEHFPSRIECMDNSHIAGDEPVAAMVAFTEGTKDKSRYRKYKLKDTDPSDDYGAMKEVLTRRYSRAKSEDDLPDLLIVDGGKGQLNIALQVLQDLDIISIDVIGLAKEEGRHDKGITAEKVFIPNVKDPIHLPKRSSVLFLLQRIRDEAHRFAITFHKQRRSKKFTKSELESLPGFGPVKCKKLLKTFGSVKAMKTLERETFETVSFLSTKDVETLWGFLHP